VVVPVVSGASLICLATLGALATQVWGGSAWRGAFWRRLGHGGHGSRWSVVRNHRG
jgi:hypothetical protein